MAEVGRGLMALGSLVIDERIFAIRSLVLGEGAIQAEILLSARDVALVPEGYFDWSLHAPDGSFICRGKLLLGERPIPRERDSVELTLSLGIEGKMATQTVA